MPSLGERRVLQEGQERLPDRLPSLRFHERFNEVDAIRLDGRRIQTRSFIQRRIWSWGVMKGCFSWDQPGEWLPGEDSNLEPCG